MILYIHDEKWKLFTFFNIFAIFDSSKPILKLIFINFKLAYIVIYAFLSIVYLFYLRKISNNNISNFVT